MDHLVAVRVEIGQVQRLLLVALPSTLVQLGLLLPRVREGLVVRVVEVWVLVGLLDAGLALLSRTRVIHVLIHASCCSQLDVRHLVIVVRMKLLLFFDVLVFHKGKSI